tara:strand:- start:11452 stop:12432 length:981 start_codon:yes stop_codon:yes gene_type:complete
MILLRSPYIISVGEIDNLGFCILSLTIDGATTPQYTITKNAYQFIDSNDDNQGFCSFDIAELCRDYITNTYQDLAVTNTVDTVAISWSILKYSSANPSVLIGSPVTGSDTGINGYTEFSEGLNAEITTDTILLSGQKIYLPLNVRTTIFTFESGSIVNNDVSSSATSISVLGGKGIEVERIRECKYRHFKVTFINKYGVLQDLYFFMKRIDSTSVTNENYKANVLNLLQATPSYSTTSHVNKTFNFKGQESFTMSTGYVDESYNSYLQELMLSEFIWVKRSAGSNSPVVPCVLNTQSFVKKTSLNDKLVEYTLEFSPSNQIVNNVR